MIGVRVEFINATGLLKYYHLVLAFKEFHDILPDIQYLNIGKQVSKSMRELPFLKEVHRLFIGLKNFISN